MSSRDAANYPFVGLPAPEDVSTEEVQHRFRQSDSTFTNPEEQRRHTMEKRKKSEPITFNSSRPERSESNEQLYQDAECRDYCMYQRIVGGMYKRTAKSHKAPVDPSLVNVIRTRHAYDTMADSDLSFSHDLDTEEMVSTPVTSNAPVALVQLLAFAPRAPLDTMRLPRHLPLVGAMVRCAEATGGEDCWTDEMFDIDL